MSCTWDAAGWGDREGGGIGRCRVPPNQPALLALLGPDGNQDGEVA